MTTQLHVNKYSNKHIIKDTLGNSSYSDETGLRISTIFKEERENVFKVERLDAADLRG